MKSSILFRSLSSALLVASCLIASASAFANEVVMPDKCLNGLCVGDRAAMFEKKYNVCTITALINITNFWGNVESRRDLKAQASCANGSTIQGGRWDATFNYAAKGCMGSICVGDEVASFGSGTPYKLVGIRRDLLTKRTTYYDSSPFMIDDGKERTTAIWSQLTKKNFCAAGLCVGDQVLYTQGKGYQPKPEDYRNMCGKDDSLFGDGHVKPCDPRLRLASIEKVSFDGDVAIRRIGGDNRPELEVYTPTFFAITKGCADNLCVGQKVTTSSKREAVIAGLSRWKKSDDYPYNVLPVTYVIKYSDNGKYGEGWKKSDLTLVTP